MTWKIYNYSVTESECNWLCVRQPIIRFVWCMDCLKENNNNYYYYNNKTLSCRRATSLTPHATCQRWSKKSPQPLLQRLSQGGENNAYIFTLKFDHLHVPLHKSNPAQEKNYQNAGLIYKPRPSPRWSWWNYPQLPSASTRESTAGRIRCSASAGIITTHGSRIISILLSIWCQLSPTGVAADHSPSQHQERGSQRRLDLVRCRPWRIHRCAGWTWRRWRRSPWQSGSECWCRWCASVESEWFCALVWNWCPTTRPTERLNSRQS